MAKIDPPPTQAPITKEKITKPWSTWLQLLRAQVNALDASTDTFSFTSYGGVVTTSPVVGGPTSIGALWEPLTFSMEAQPATAVHMTVDTVNGTVQPHYSGAYAASVTVAFEHNSSNNGRTTHMRLYNITQGVAGGSVVVGTGRNAEATSMSVSLVAVIENNNDVFRLELGGGDDYSLISWDAVALQIWSIGTFTGNLGEV